MKRLVFIFASLTIFLSCSSDVEPTIESISSGTLKINNNKELHIDKGFIIPPYTGTNTDYNPRRYYIILTDGDVTIGKDNKLIYADNIHQAIDFNLNTDIQNPKIIQQTVYELWTPKMTGFDLNSAYIDHSGINSNVVMKNGLPVSMDKLSSDDMNTGILRLSIVNDVYNLEYIFENNTNKVSGKFVGKLKILNLNR